MNFQFRKLIALEFPQLNKPKHSLRIESRRVSQFTPSRIGSDHPEWNLQSLLLRIFDGDSTIRRTGTDKDA
jgi:hypothetical protein